MRLSHTRAVALALATAAAGTAVHATCWAPYRPRLRFRGVSVPATWPALDILHLSDLHIRRQARTAFAAQRRALERLAAQPDVVCVTGDVCEQTEDAPLVAELLAGLRPRLGTFVILGNHEYGAHTSVGGSPHTGPVARLMGHLYGPTLSRGAAEADGIAGVLTDHGLCVLRNRGVRLGDDTPTLWLAGVDSTWAGRADVGAAFDGWATGEPALALIHEPEGAFKAIDHGADLVLAGHTHGGQVRLPFSGPPHWHRRDARLTQPAGLQRIGRAYLHISPGTGQLLPLRILCPPELVWLRCTPRTAGAAAIVTQTGGLGTSRS
jgi:predicted MPP superfamily phosphohydrolase